MFYYSFIFLFFFTGNIFSDTENKFLEENAESKLLPVPSFYQFYDLNSFATPLEQLIGMYGTSPSNKNQVKDRCFQNNKKKISINDLHPIFIVIGTRPEGIKLIPLYLELKSRSIPTVLCSTGQHEEMLNEVFRLFKVVPDYNLHIMKPGQTLAYVTTKAVKRLEGLFKKVDPSLVVVQGDTSSAFAGALAAYYNKIPVAHLEAGLRTGNIYSPFPEEFNRQAITRIAGLHFAHTHLAIDNLLKEGVKKESIFYTGNTGIDALKYIQKQIEIGAVDPSDQVKEVVTNLKKENKKIVLLTLHRREALEDQIKDAICLIEDFLKSHPDIVLIYPCHPRPEIQKIIKELDLVNHANIKLLSPLDYIDMMYVLKNAAGAITDSGGVQEEAISLAKPVIVLRDHTERIEGVWCNLAYLVGFDLNKIKNSLKNFGQLLDPRSEKNAEYNTIYGDGKAARYIADIITDWSKCL